MNPYLNLADCLISHKKKFSKLHIYHFAKKGDHMSMDIKDIRRKNLRHLLDALGLKSYQFAEKVGTSASTISQYSADSKTRNMGDELARRIEQAFGLPHGYMDKEHAVEKPYAIDDSTYSHKNIENNHGQIYRFDLWDSSTPINNEEVEVPLYMEVELSAGIGRTCVQHDTGAKIRFARSTLRNAGVQPESAAACFASGNSMHPVVPNGAAVGIDTAYKKIIDGEIYAIEHDGMLKIKYLYRLTGGGIRLRSENRDEYPDEDLFDNDLLEFKIIGYVFWISTIRHRRS